MEGATTVNNGEAGEGGASTSGRAHTEGRSIFLQVMEAAWGHLGSSAARKAVRASCRDGLCLHDRLTTYPIVCLSNIGPEVDICATLTRAAVRGFRPQGLEVDTTDVADPEQGLHQSVRHLLAACRALPQPEAVASLTLDGGALNPGNAESIADTFPGLRSIDIAAAYDKDAEDGVVSGAVRLLTRCGPRLNHLKLSVCGWTPPCLVHLRSCTALTTLDLRMADLSTAQPNEGGICQRVESAFLDSVARLTQLQHLSLDLAYDTVFDHRRLASAQRHAPALQQLSSLTALKSLDLTLPHRARYDDTFEDRQALLDEGRATFDAWQAVWEAQERALGQALRCMPHLTELVCGPSINLKHADLAALTALTRLSIASITLPPEGQDRNASNAVVSAPLPPSLRLFDTDAPVEVLAALHVSQGARTSFVNEPSAHCVWFGPSVLSEDGSRLRQVAVEAVRGAVQLMAGELAGGEGPGGSGGAGSDHSVWDDKMLELDARGVPELLLPPAAGEGEAHQGHAVWIRELAPLDRRKVVFKGLTLEVTDLMCIASTFSRVKVLALYGCRFPVAALPALAQLPLLETLVADVSDLRCGAEELVASLVLLAVGPPRLVRVRVAGCHGRQYVDVEYIKAEVLRCLALRGRTGVSVHVLGDTHEQGQFDEEADAFGEAEA